MQLEKLQNRPFFLSIIFYQESYPETAQSLDRTTMKEIRPTRKRIFLLSIIHFTVMYVCIFSCSLLRGEIGNRIEIWLLRLAGILMLPMGVVWKRIKMIEGIPNFQLPFLILNSFLWGLAIAWLIYFGAVLKNRQK